MRGGFLLALIALWVAMIVAPSWSQVPVNPQAAQIAGLRKELQRQRKSQEALGKELQASRATVEQLNRKASEQDQALESLRRDLARTWAGGAVGLAALFFVLLLIAFRRPRSAPAPPDELQQRLAALDRKLRDLTR